MKKITSLAFILLCVTRLGHAESDEEAILASLNTTANYGQIEQVEHQEKASADWTDAMQKAWGKTRPLSDLKVIQKQVIREVKEVISKPIVGGIRRNIPADIQAIIKKYADKYGVSENLIKALIQVESSFNPKAVSKAGAKGLMQLMPMHTDPKGIDAFNPDANVQAGLGLLSHLLNKYNSLDLALAAYNAGEGAVDKYGGIPPYPETQAYVKKIMGLLGG